MAGENYLSNLNMKVENERANYSSEGKKLEK